MVVVVFAALVGAPLTDFNAFAQHMLSMVGAAGNEGGGKAADIGAVAVEANAGHHHLNIFFAQTSVGAHFAGGNAAAQGVKNLLGVLILGSVSARLIHDE
jgi:hypothetical protein